LLAPSKPADTVGPPLPHLSDLYDDGRPVPTASEMERLAASDPVAFLEACWKRYHREYHGFRCRMYKQEGDFPPEDVEVAFRDNPHAAFLRWHSGARKVFGVLTVRRALYVAGENKGQAVVGLTGPFGNTLTREIDPLGEQARESGRYPLTEFGLKKAIERTWKAWRAARSAGRLMVEYQGVRPLPEVGGRPCHVFLRTCDPPEEEGLTRLEVAIDAENWLQVSSKLTNAEGKRIGTYHFRDVQLNPAFDPQQFTRAALAR
jgi:hypothetical protein